MGPEHHPCGASPRRQVPGNEERANFSLTFDPIRYASYVDPKKVLLVLARYDTVVPVEKGLELKAKMRNPETIMLPAGHYSAALSIPSEIFGGTMYVATVLSPTLLERVKVIVRRLPSQVTSAVG